MTHPLPCECQEGYLSGLTVSQRESIDRLVADMQSRIPQPDRPEYALDPTFHLGTGDSTVTLSRQHLSGIHPPGGRVPPTEPVRFPIAKPGGIGYYVTPTRTTEPTADVARASVSEIVARSFDATLEQCLSGDVEPGRTSTAPDPPPSEVQQRWSAAVAMHKHDAD